MLWRVILSFSILLVQSVWQIEAQYGYQMMPQPMLIAPQPALMVPQRVAPVGFGGMQQYGHGYGGVPQGGRAGLMGGVQKGQWSECSKTCGADSYRTRTYTPCDASKSSCTEKEGCIVPECGKTKNFKEGDKIKVPCHGEARKEGYRAQWFKYEDDQHTWKYVTLESERKFMDEQKNLVVASATSRDQGTYRCNLLSREGTRVAESIWHFSVKSRVNKGATGIGTTAAIVVIAVIVICICIAKCRKSDNQDGTGKNKASGGEEGGGYDFGEDFDFGY